MHEDASFDIVGRNLIIRLNCELDHHISEQIRKRIDNIIDTKAIKNIIFDFEKVSFMDSSGIGVIMGRYKKVVFNSRNFSCKSFISFPSSSYMISFNILNKSSKIFASIISKFIN